MKLIDMFLEISAYSWFSCCYFMYALIVFRENTRLYRMIPCIVFAVLLCVNVVIKIKTYMKSLEPIPTNFLLYND